jgi:hypothetical protein
VIWKHELFVTVEVSSSVLSVLLFTVTFSDGSFTQNAVNPLTKVVLKLRSNTIEIKCIKLLRFSRKLGKYGCLILNKIYLNTTVPTKSSGAVQLACTFLFILLLSLCEIAFYVSQTRLKNQ